MKGAEMMSSRHVFTPILIAASLVLLISFAIRASFGVFQIPIANDLGWFRTEFSVAIAIQNLAWGIATPLFSAFAEKLGDRKAVVVGVLVYAFGLALSSMASTATSHQLLEILVGVLRANRIQLMLVYGVEYFFKFFSGRKLYA